MKEYKASWINKMHFAYKCDQCKKKFHIHGSSDDYVTNRVEIRSTHCPKFKGDIMIKITPETECLIEFN